ncbi:unnamed protein product [Ixodes pacificus]
MSASCVVCSATNYCDSKDTARLFRFPSPLLHPEKRAAWVAAVRSELPDGSLWEPIGDCHICSAHFVTGRPSNFKDRPDFVPTVFNRTRPGDTALQPYNFCVERQKGKRWISLPAVSLFHPVDYTEDWLHARLHALLRASFPLACGTVALRARS